MPSLSTIPPRFKGATPRMSATSDCPSSEGEPGKSVNCYIVPFAQESSDAFVKYYTTSLQRATPRMSATSDCPSSRENPENL